MWPSRIGTYPPTNSAGCLRMLPPECSHERRGRNGMNNLECRYRLCLGASFPMAHSVPSLAISLVDDCGRLAWESRRILDLNHLRFSVANSRICNASPNQHFP